MERKCGEIFCFEGVTLQVVADGRLSCPCNSCYFGRKPTKCVGHGEVVGPCSESLRKDKMGVHFEEVKKGGRE